MIRDTNMIDRRHIYIRGIRLLRQEIGCWKMRSRESYAVVEVIGIIFVITIATSAIVLITFWYVPYMDEKKAAIRAESALAQFNLMGDIIQDVVSQGFNSSNSANFVTDAGQVYIDSNGERFVLYYSLNPNFDFNVTGFYDGDDEGFSFIVEKDPLVQADHIDVYYLYPDFSNDPDLDLPINTPGLTEVGVTHPLVDAVQIDVNDSSDTLIGRIWLFDSGSITYESPSSSGSHKVIAENGGIISGRVDSGYLANEPNIYNRKDLSGNSLLEMRVIQLKSGSVAGGSGGGEYQFTIGLNSSDIREYKADIPERFKMQIFGDAAAVKAWENYFELQHDFGKYEEGTAQGTLYLDGDKIFTLTHSICDLTLEVTG